MSLLKQENPPSGVEIACIVGCSYGAIKHLRAITEVSKNSAERLLSEYGRRLARSLPLRERVKLYTELARGEIDAKRAFSALKALQRIEELEGIVTERERRDAETRVPPAPPGAVFVIQGATISVGADPIGTDVPQAVVVDVPRANLITDSAKRDPVESRG